MEAEIGTEWALTRGWERSRAFTARAAPPARRLGQEVSTHGLGRHVRVVSITRAVGTSGGLWAGRARRSQVKDLICLP